MTQTIRQRRELERANHRHVDNGIGLIAALVGMAIILIAIWENT